MDGNFTAYHIKQARMTTDVALTAGEGFMTEQGKYKEYVKATTEIREAWMSIVASLYLAYQGAATDMP